MPESVETLRQELEKKQQALQASEARFRNIIERNADGILVVDREGVVRFVNRAAEAMLARSAGELIGSFFGFPLAADQVAEIDLVRRNGTVALAEMRVVESEWEGSPVYLATLRDITQRKRIESQRQKALEASRESEAKFRTLFDHASDAIFIHDTEGRFLEVNQVACRRLGYSREELLRLTPVDIDAPQYAELVQDRMEILVQKGQATFETAHVRRDGRAIPIELNSRIIEFAGQPAVLSIARDITERQQAEEALAWEAGVNAAMAELAQALISNSMTIEDISYRVLKHAKQLTNSQFGYVGYIDPQTGHLVSPTMTRDIWDACEVPDKSIVFETFSGLWGWVLEHRQPLLTNAPLDDPRSSGVPKGHLSIDRFLSAPAMVGPTLVGQVALANADDDYVQQDLDVVERLASLYALAVQRKQAETALQEAKEQVVSILDSISDAFFALDQDLVVTYFNRAAERVLGRKSEEVLGYPLFEAFPEAKGSVFEEKYTFALAEKKPLTFETYFGVAPYANWYDVRVYPYQEGISVYFQVTTERKVAEQVLQESEEKYRTLVEQSLQGVIIAQANPVRLSFANEPMEAICGYSREELVRLGPEQLAGLIHPKDREAFFQNFQDRLAGKDVEPRRAYRIIHRDGGLRWAETYSSRIEYEGEPATLTVFLDITERKRVEEELARSNAELEQFAYIASHDLQEPLRTVSSYVQLLGRCYAEELDAEAQEYITFAVDGVGRMQDLIRDLLEYSRVDRLGQAFELTDSEFAVGIVLDSLQMAIEEADATVTHDPLPTVVADSTQLGQVFQNLVSNALKFHGKEPPRVHISAEVTDNEWLFAVRDNGIGIEPQFQERIFDVFERLHTRDEYPGTGVGLALCKKIVERHGGRIWVDSQPGQGSMFWFSISRRGGSRHGTKSGP